MFQVPKFWGDFADQVFDLMSDLKVNFISINWNGESEFQKLDVAFTLARRDKKWFRKGRLQALTFSFQQPLSEVFRKSWLHLA